MGRDCRERREPVRLASHKCQLKHWNWKLRENDAAAVRNWVTFVIWSPADNQWTKEKLGSSLQKTGKSSASRDCQILDKMHRNSKQVRIIFFAVTLSRKYRTYCKVGINQTHVSRSRSIIRQLLSVSVFPCTTGSPLRHIGLGNGTYLTPEGPYQERLRQKIGNWGYPWLGLLHSGQGKGLESFFQYTLRIS